MNNHEQVDNLISEFRQQIRFYLNNYFSIRGYVPKDVKPMVFSTIDSYSDPKIRTLLRRGLTKVSVKRTAEGQFAVDFIFTKTSIKKLHQILSS